MKNSSHLIALPLALGPDSALELHFSHPHLPLFQCLCPQSKIFAL